MHNFDYSSNNAADAATTATKTTTCMILLLLLLPLLLYYYYLLLPFKRRLFKGYFTNRFRLEYFQSYITSSLYLFLIGGHNTNAKYIWKHTFVAGEEIYFGCTKLVCILFQHIICCLNKNIKLSTYCKFSLEMWYQIIVLRKLIDFK